MKIELLLPPSLDKYLQPHQFHIEVLRDADGTLSFLKVNFSLPAEVQNDLMETIHRAFPTSILKINENIGQADLYVEEKPYFVQLHFYAIGRTVFCRSKWEFERVQQVLQQVIQKTEVKE